MKILWMIITVGLTLAEKLDRTYLPPPGSTFSGGSPGVINLPLEVPKLQNSLYDDKKIPEIVIGIDRVGPNQVADSFKDISTSQPQFAYNDKTFTSPPTTTLTNFKQSSPFSMIDDYSTPISTVTSDSNDLLNGTNALQYFADTDVSNMFSAFPSIDTNYNQFQHINKYPNESNNQNQAYLPSYSEVTDKTADVTFSTMSSPIEYQYTENKHKFPQPDSSSSLNHVSKPYDSMSLGHFNEFNDNISPTNYNVSTFSQSSGTISTSDVNTSKFSTSHPEVRPDRIQAQSDRQALILNYDQVITPEGYNYSYDTSNGIHADESAIAINGVQAKGSYSYIGDDGKFYRVEYTADENGFVPKGAHLPTPPPIPDAILKVIEQAEKDKEAGIYDDGTYDEKKYGFKNYRGNSQNNYFINGVDLPPENNLMYVETDNQLNKDEDLQVQNSLDKTIKNYQHNYGDNTEATTYKTIYDNATSYHIDDEIMISPNYNDLLHQPENNLFPNLKDLFKQSDIMENSKNIFQGEGPSNTNDENSHTELANQYLPSKNEIYQTKRLQLFPSRFSGIEQHNIKDKENITEKITAKPFLTPYVSRNDDFEYYDFDENSFGNRYQENHRESPMHLTFVSQNIEPNEKFMNTGEVDSHEFVTGMTPEQRQSYENSQQNSNHLIPSGEKGYFYHNIIDSQHQPFVTTDRNIHTGSTAVPTEFPPRFTTQVKHIKSNTPEIIEPSFQSPSLNSVFLINDSKPSEPDIYDKSKTINSDKDIQDLRPGLTSDTVKFGMLHSPGSEMNIYSNDRTSTENNLGEDFSGPSNVQYFDSTGYHYK